MAVYKGLEATLHEAFWGDRGSDLEVKEIMRLFPDFSGKALEVGAGSGRILRPLAEAYWDIEGIEPATEMVEMFEETCDPVLKGAIKPVKLEEYESTEKYDVVLMTSYVFQLFEEPGEVFAKAKELLAPGGRLYFSVFIPWAEIVGELIEGEWLVDDEIKLPENKRARCWVNFELNRVRQRLIRKHRYEISQRKQVLEMTKTEQHIRWYTLPEMELQFEKYGLEMQSLSCEFTEEFDQDAHSMSFVVTVKED